VQTLLQLLPKEIQSKVVVNAEWSILCAEIIDYPKLSWRGFMLDVSRHFFTKDEVKRYIDNMVIYKYNLLHLHLTDNEGWRIEIKKYPKLTSIGAWRVNRIGNFGTFTPPGPEEASDYGGFYTQEDIKEIVQYAKERFVDILPEIDVPGHSLAAVSAYPELSCTPEAVNYRVRSGEKIMDWSAGGELPQAIYDNNLCPANENVYGFLDDVIKEIAPLFPFSYIHMGGDETSTNYWEKSEAVKALMKRENLKDMHAVQGYFSKRVKSLVEKNGKKFMGWDEILTGGLSPDAAVMAWRKPEKGVEASLKKHKVVMTPFTYTYLDLMQADAITEAPVYKEVRLNKAYQFEPIPEGADVAQIMGGQANIWTEQIYNIRHAEYMAWPRGMAISESLWSATGTKNWPDFVRRVERHFERLDISETKYARSMYDPIFKASSSVDGQLQVELSTEIEGLDIYYSFDNSFPDRFYPKYTERLIPPSDATLLRVITYRGNKPIGRMQNMPLEELNKRAEKK
jgi:hexosaminidase